MSSSDRRHRLATGVLPALLFVTHCGAPATREPTPTPRVRCVPVGTRSLADEVVLRGVVVPAPDRSATLSAEVAGRLVRLAVREGDDVETGDLIAEVETQPARDVLQHAQALLAEATANRDAARVEADHEQALVDRGISAPRSLETLRAALIRAEAAVNAASAQVHAARQRVSRSTIHAPIAGSIVHVRRRAGELVDGTPATPICDVVDMSALEVAAPAAPADLVRLQRDQPATVRFAALEGVEIPATVRAVGRAVDHSGMGQVWLTLQPQSLRPPLGVQGAVSIALSAPHDVVTVPPVAVRSAGGNQLEVLACDGNAVHVREVQVGRRTDQWVELTGGAAVGDSVAIDEVTGLQDGDAIELAPDAP